MAVCVVLTQMNITTYNIRWTRILRPAFIVNFSESRQVKIIVL